MRARSLGVFGCVLLGTITGCAVTHHRSDQQARRSIAGNGSTALPVPSPRRCEQSIQCDGSRWPDSAAAFVCAHPRVDTFVAPFQTDLRRFFDHALSRSGRYVPGMAAVLEQEGVPQELVYLPLIESGFRLQAVSRAGAVGPWQLIRATARRYGLRIDRYVDERRDPVKSTRAAARYLRDLQAMFGDWHLSLAAYNTGEGTIARIRARRHLADFWQMRAGGYLYPETADFVPAFLAALRIAVAPERYGFTPPTALTEDVDVTRVDRWLRLSTVARLCGTSVAALQALNPALHGGIVPTGYMVRLPKGSQAAFQSAVAVAWTVRNGRRAPLRHVRCRTTTQIRRGARC